MPDNGNISLRVCQRDGSKPRRGGLSIEIAVLQSFFFFLFFGGPAHPWMFSAPPTLRLWMGGAVEKQKEAPGTTGIYKQATPSGFGSNHLQSQNLPDPRRLSYCIRTRLDYTARVAQG